MLIGIGSENKTKISACKKAVRQILTQSADNHKNIQFKAIPASTDVPDMPLSLPEIRSGARQRAYYVYRNFPEADICIGLEGGVFIPEYSMNEESYLQNWAYAFDGNKGHYGSSPALPLPAVIKKALYNNGRELAEVIDEFSGKTDVRSNEGAFGVLTRDLITRTDAFVFAVICALTPLIFKSAYQPQDIS